LIASVDFLALVTSVPAIVGMTPEGAEEEGRSPGESLKVAFLGKLGRSELGMGSPGRKTGGSIVVVKHQEKEAR
jgi:hypothetical protein